MQPQVEAFIAKYTEVPEGADKAELTPEGLIAYVSTYAEATTGVDVSGLTPENVTAMVSAYKELAAGADISTLKPGEITAYISTYLEQSGVDTSGLTPDGLTAFVLAYQEVTGGALTMALAPGDITAMVARYMEAENIDLSALSPDQVEAVVSAFSEAANCDKSQLLQDFTAYITRYDDTNAQKPTLSVSVGIYGYDLIAYRKFIEENPVEVQGIVKLGEVFQNPADALLDPQTKFWQDGQEIPVQAVPTEMLTADKVAVLDEDGTLHVLIAPDVTGAQEAIANLRAEVAEVDQFGLTALGKAAGLLPETSLDLIESALSRLQSYQETLDYSAWDKFWASVFGASTDKGTLDTSMKLDFPAERVAELSTYVAEIVAAIQQGQEVKQEDLDNLQAILTFLQGLDTAEVGTHILEGVGEGMTAAGWDSDAETVASNLEARAESGAWHPFALRTRKARGTECLRGRGPGHDGIRLCHRRGGARGHAVRGNRPGPAAKRAGGLWHGGHDRAGAGHDRLWHKCHGCVGRRKCAQRGQCQPERLDAALRGRERHERACGGHQRGPKRRDFRHALRGPGCRQRGQERAENQVPLAGVRGRGGRDDHARLGPWRAQGKQGAGEDHPKRSALPDRRSAGREHSNHQQRQPAHLQ